MSGVDEEVSNSFEDLNSLDTLTLDDPSETPILLPPTLETLPNELLSSIVLNLDKFVLPPLSRRLLPFHRSSLYQTVFVNLKQFDAFYYTIELYPHLPEFVEDLTFSFTIPLNERNASSLSIPLRKIIDELLASLPNLERLTIIVDGRWKSRFSPSFKDFERNPKLQTLIIKSSFVEFSVAETHEEEEEEPQMVDIFDFSYLDSITEDEVGAALDSIVDEFSFFPEPESILEIHRFNSHSPDLTFRYFGVSTNSDVLALHQCLSVFSISHLQLVEFDYSPSIISLLRVLAHPLSLTYLSLYTRGEEQLDPPYHLNDTLASFVNLTHLSVGGNVLEYFPHFYEDLKLLPLEYLCFGPHVQLRLDSLMKTIPTLTNLKTLVLDNVRTVEEKEDGTPKDNIPPVFPAECSYNEMPKLLELGKRLGITITGSTIRAVAQKEAHGEHLMGAIFRLCKVLNL